MVTVLERILYQSNMSSERTLLVGGLPHLREHCWSYSSVTSLASCAWTGVFCRNRLVMRVSRSVSGEHNFTIVLPGRLLVILNAFFADEGELL